MDTFEAFSHFPKGSIETAVLFIIVLFTLLIWKALTVPYNLPPGPRGIPLFGYLPFLGNKPHVTLNELAKKYGNIYSVYFGSRLVIVLNSYDAVKAALVKQGENFHGKLSAEFLQKGEVAGIFQAEGELWKSLRRFSLSTLRDFGFGKLSQEPRIKEEIQCMLDTIQSHDGKPVDIGNLLRMSISNVVCSLIFGKRFEYSDNDFKYLIKVLNEFLQDTRIVNYYALIPYLMKIPGVASWLGHGRPSTEKQRILIDYMTKKVAERANRHQSGTEDDFIAAWLTEAEKRDDADKKYFSNEYLTRMVVALFNAGTDTTANSLRWGLLYLMKHPEIQKRVQQEIDDVIGHERTPSINDQERMPYTQATLMEIHRISSLVPTLPHCNLTETTLLGFSIPKRCIIMSNLWAVHHDPETFPEPDEFKPERFLDANGKVRKEEKLIPFSIGKRQCLGESLARMELFLYFTSMLQRFTFKIPKGNTLSFDYDMSQVLMPKPYELIGTIREVVTKES